VSDWLADIVDWPVLRGYFTTTAKPAARVDLTVKSGEGEEPLLARWTVGRGRVVSFTSDADTRWSPEWIRWPGFEGAWAQIIRWAMRPRLTEELFVWVDESRDVPQLVVEGALHDPHGKLLAGEGAQTIPLSFIQVGSWRWHASLDQVPSGWYQLALEAQLPSSPPKEAGQGPASPPAPADAAQPGEGSPPVFATRWVQVGTPVVLQERIGQPPREELLNQIAHSTGGSADAADLAFLPPTTTATVTTPLLTWWLPLVVLLLLLDIWIRGNTML
jgi:hypothetical protein